MFKGYPYPEPLPSSTSRYIRSPYKNIYQGINRRLKGDMDKRVYNKKFKYAAKPIGHHLYCEGVFDCIISRMAIETNGSIPIILRGGVGYKYFSVAIKAYPGEELSGTVRAYCPSPNVDGS
ncbi:uncharacterized protein LOC123692741 [Colias croceus]|uniref:uncharacterized protein LOC123692741 n=1 Tax=Colias crocea TaxID=72248 RepID=UPI001E27DEC6|nr:uncharacterized protein LOC123692741 [Colias croceus]